MNVLYDSASDIYYIVGMHNMEFMKPSRWRKLAPVDPQLASNIVQQFDTISTPGEYLKIRIGSALYKMSIPEGDKWYMAKLLKS